MTEEEYRRIEAMIARQVGLLREEMQSQADTVMADSRHQTGIAMEDAQHKFELLAEGQQMLVERMDRMEVNVLRVEGKVDNIDVELAAHRADTEAHRGVYGVRES